MCDDRQYGLAILFPILVFCVLSGCTDSEATPSGNLVSAWLEGEVKHDFGDVDVYQAGEPTKLTHTFVLTNQGEHGLEIVDVEGTCGCLEAVAEPELIEPGESVHVTVTMAIKTGGRKTERIHLFANDEVAPVQTLLLAATGILDAGILGFPRYVSLQPEKPATMTLAVVYGSAGRLKPPAPTFTNPHGVNAEFGGWERLTPDWAINEGAPIRWQGDVTFTAQRKIEPYESAEARVAGFADFIVIVFLDPAHATH